MKVMVAGVFGLDAAKVNQGAAVVGVTGIKARGALVTVTTVCTGPPFSAAFRKTTFGVAVMVFCACKANVLPMSTVAIARERES